MIKQLEEKDFETAARMMHSLNQNQNYYSGFCSNSLAAIKNDLNQAKEEGILLGYYKDASLLGVLMMVRRPNQDYDCIGPYCLNGDLSLATKLLKKGLQMQSAKDVHFFFDQSSDYYKRLTNAVKAEFQDTEYIMKCRSLIPMPDVGNEYELVKPISSEKNLIKRLYEDIFGQTYLPSSTFVDDKHFPYIYLFKEKTNILGIALMKEQKDKGYLEFFGLIPSARGRGLSRIFLHKVLKKGLQEKGYKEVILVVDQVNSVASSLYLKAGFEIDKVNVSYRYRAKKEER